jgi:hypothetical protein
MSFQIPTHFVETYRSNLTMLLQQRGSKLAPYVRTEMQSAEYDFYDRIGATEAQEVTTRHSDTPLIHTPHDRRRAGLRDFDWADLIDNRDKIRLLADPTSAYTMNAVWAMGRRKDDVILEAAFGTAWTGKKGTAAVTFPASQQVGVDYVETGAAANSGLTIGKLRRARALFGKAEIEEDAQLYIAVTADDLHALLTNKETTSADYNTVRALVAGEINSFMGFTFVHCERIKTDGDGYRRLPCWERSGLLLAMGQDIVTDIGPRRDKRNSIQVYVSASFDAVRMEEKRVIEIKADPAVLRDPNGI